MELGAQSSFNVYPTHAFNYPRLRSLTVKTRQFSVAPRTEYDPYLVRNDELVKAHNTLSRLKIHGSSAFTVLLASKTRPAIGVLLPSLTSLILESNGHFSGKHFHNIPPKLTHLSLRSTWHQSNSSATILPCSLISLLPRTLEMLDIPSILFDNKHREIESISFPPALTHALIGFKYINPILKILPTSMVSLSIHLTYHGDLETLKSSNLTRLASLTSFTLESSRISLMLDAPFSPTITELHLPKFPFPLLTGDSQRLADLNGLLPRSLTSLRGLHATYEATNWDNMFPLLKHLELQLSGVPPQTILPPLVSIDIGSLDHIDGIDRLLPDTLTNLRTYIREHPEWLTAIAKLTRLEHLEILHGKIALSSHGIWNVLKPRLKSLSTSLGAFGLIEDIGCGWTKLHTLSLQVYSDGTRGPLPARSPNDDIFTQTTGISLLPSNLTSLTLLLETHHNAFLQSLKYLLQLKTLNLKIMASDDTVEIEQEEALLKLPNTLTSLTLRTCRPLPLDMLKSLPTGLIALFIQLDSLANMEWTENHILALKLLKRSSLTLLGGTQSVADKPPSIFPSTMLSCFIGFSELTVANKAGNESRRQVSLGKVAM